MYIVIYSFKIKPNQTNTFIKSWKGLTQLIYEFEGSLGSRLHLKSKDEYIAYAQWPSKDTFEASGKNLPKKADDYRELMKNTCLKIEILDQMEVIEDLLINNNTK